MINKDLIRHASEFRSALDNHKYEKTGAGLLFPRAHLLFAGAYTHTVNDQDPRTDANLIVDEGLIHMIGVELAAVAQITTWYLALYAANYTPLAALTAASFTSTASEITSGSEGYSQSTRVAWTPGTVAADAVDNSASPATFTIVTASTLAVNGAALVSASAKGSTAGKLVSASKFATTRSLSNADSFKLAYAVSFTST